MRSSSSRLRRITLVLALAAFASAPSAASAADGEPAAASTGADSASSGTAKADAKGAKVDLATDSSDVTEDPLKRYYFVGLRYRGTIVPKFIQNLFVNEGGTIYSNTIGLEADIRKDGFSLIPAISYAEYGTGDLLFFQKNKEDIPGNWSMVNSGLKSLYLTADLLWSTQVHKNLDIEYGFGVGIGIIFGSLITNWVRPNPGGNLTDSKGRTWSACKTEGEGGGGSGCNRADHQNSDVAKVNGYEEPSWFSGGSKPNIFPWIALPQIGVRFKPVKQFEGRLGIGFSLTGFFFGLSGNYGLEQPEKKVASDDGPRIAGAKVHFGGPR